MIRAKDPNHLIAIAEIYLKTLNAQTTPTKPEEGENPAEEKLEAPTQQTPHPTTTQQPQQSTQQHLPSTQQHLPFYPDWVKRLIRCQYPNCTNTLDPQNPNTYRDYETGKLYCVAHTKECKECQTEHLQEDMVAIPKTDRHGMLRGNDCVCQDCCDENYTTCPHCKKIVKKDEILLPTNRNKWSMKHGGCDKCAVKCSSCDRIVDNDEARTEDNKIYCDDCWSENFDFCEGCQNTITRDESRYVEGGGSFCEHCFDHIYTTCVECDKTIEKSDAHEIGDDIYCEECYKEKGPAQYKQFTEKFSEFSYTKKDRYLSLLYKLLPISSKQLKSKHQSIAAGLSELIAFAKGGTITKELVKEYRQSLNPEEFPVDYTVWHGIQRSVEKVPRTNTAPYRYDQLKDQPQLVINVIASEEMLDEMKTSHTIATVEFSGSPIYDLFDKINTLSHQSTHPYVKDQIGWIRVELDPRGEYVLVDEVQSDHSNATYQLKNGVGYEMQKLRAGIKQKYKLDDEELTELLSEYASIIKDFPNIAAQAVLRFARKNGFKKIYWHTYEGGKNLKNNEPPKSLYEKTPKENFYLPTKDKPFGLEEEFFEREARKIILLYKMAARYLNNL